MLDLTDNEIRDIVRYLEARKPLPEKYRFLLFEDKREVELVWNGKTDDICNVVLPFQIIEQVDEPRAEIDTTMQLGLFDLDDRGRQLKGWTNKLIWGDNKLILSSLKNGPLRQEIENNGGIKLIYIDPPFDVGADFSMDIPIGDEQFTKQPSVLEELAYRDTWGKGADSYLNMMYERLALMRDLLRNDGSIYVHCDWHVGYHLRQLLNEVFGRGNFCNEIVWYYYNKMHDIRKPIFPRAHDTILFYAKNRNSARVFKQLKEKREKAVKQLVRQKVNGKMINARDEEGNVLYRDTDERGVDDVWRIPMLQPADKSQNTGYLTQKNELVLRRVIEASSTSGDVIADFFCGSGTTLAVAEKLGRKWIGSDLGKFAIHTTRKRMINVQRQLKKEAKDYRAFEILNLGKYERQHYIGVNVNLRDEEKQKQLDQREKDFVELILRAYKADAADGFKTFSGKKNARVVAVGPVDLPVTRAYVDEVIKECIDKHITKVDILAFEFEMGLFPNVQEDARSRGIDLALKYIPRDVFDKRAVEKNQVVFHDVSYIEVKPHVKGTSVAVELTDFSVYYNQDTIANAEASLKDGGSKIVVENGQIIKVSKNKNGIVSREVLTKKWTDWIDYWAVDFNFESKKEIITVAKQEATQIQPDGNAEQPQTPTPEYEQYWTGDYVFENEWQSFRTRKDRTLELKSVFHECSKGPRKIAVKVVDIFGNDTMKVISINI